MKFTLHRSKQAPAEYWNGRNGLPDELHVTSPVIAVAEFELLSLLCSLHGWLTPFDLLSGAEPATEKDRDMIAVLTALQWYVYPRMPMTRYTVTGARVPEGGRRVEKK
jgi:hypothetical protein